VNKKGIATSRAVLLILAVATLTFLMIFFGNWFWGGVEGVKEIMPEKCGDPTILLTFNEFQDKIVESLFKNNNQSAYALYADFRYCQEEYGVFKSKKLKTDRDYFTDEIHEKFKDLYKKENP